MCMFLYCFSCFKHDFNIELQVRRILQALLSFTGATGEVKVNAALVQTIAELFGEALPQHLAEDVNS